MKYRKKPVVIEAFKYCYENEPSWFKDALNDGTVKIAKNNMLSAVLDIETLEGTMKCTPGNYVIRGVKGEIYPCKSDIFEATYEKVDEE